MMPSYNLLCRTFPFMQYNLYMQNQDDLKIRQRRHEQLLRMISEYCLSEEQLDYLETIKKNTEIQIASRFLKSKHNKLYKFPLQSELQPQEKQEFPRGVSFDHTTYDLRAQNYVKNQEQIKTARVESIGRRVKSLGPQKFNDKIAKDISRQLRERPQERGGKRERIFLPELNSKPNSHRVLKTESKVKSRQFSLKLMKNKNVQKVREQLVKDRRQHLGQLMNSKLLTQGETLSLGNTKILINKLRVISPAKNQLKSKKLVTQ